MLKNKLKEKWNSLDPSQQKRAVMLSVILVIVLVGYLGYKSTKRGRKVVKTKEEVKKELLLNPKLMQKTLYNETLEQLESFRKELKALKTKIKEQNERIEKEANKTEPTEEIKSSKPTRYKTEGTEDLFKKYNIKVPPPPPPPASSAGLQKGSQKPSQNPFLAQRREEKKKKAKAEPAFIGGISIEKNTVKEAQKEQRKENKKKETVYLPPSFMEATLLSGLDAPTMGDALKNPVPVLIRVRDLAILPNDVKADLKGCFVIADGVGSLADERVHLRLISLSCIAKNGQAVIDQKVKGFVVDNDGKIGLRGRVVSKMGSAIARSFLAGMFGGFGDAVRSASTTQSVSALGTTSTIKNNWSDIAKAGIGSGISTSFGRIQQFYLKLAEQAIPVIEVGATRDITLVISEGVNLEIKDYCVGGHKCKE